VCENRFVGEFFLPFKIEIDEYLREKISSAAAAEKKSVESAAASVERRERERKNHLINFMIFHSAYFIQIYLMHGSLSFHHSAVCGIAKRTFFYLDLQIACVLSCVLAPVVIVSLWKGGSEAKRENSVNL
jgi:uncharacterized membrane protein YozB (DUF420 family)